MKDGGAGFFVARAFGTPGCPRSAARGRQNFGVAARVANRRRRAREFRNNRKKKTGETGQPRVRRTYGF